MRTGQCKFGITCKFFHHPQQAGIQVPGLAPGPLPATGTMPIAGLYSTVQSPSVLSSQQYGVVLGNWPVAITTVVPGSYILGAYGPVLFSPGMLPFQGWSPYPVCVKFSALTLGSFSCVNVWFSEREK